MITNAINETLDPTVLSDIKLKLKDVGNLMPFLLSLSTEGQPLKAFKMNHKRFSFVEQTVALAALDPQLVPNWISFETLQNDFLLSQQLFGIEAMILALQLQLRDTRMQIGSEALLAATDIYNHTKRAKANIPGLEPSYQTLKQAFGGRGKAKTTEK